MEIFNFCFSEHFTEAVLMSTHDLCFGSKIRKNVNPSAPQFYYIKEGYKGVYITWSCFPDDGEVFRKEYM